MRINKRRPISAIKEKLDAKFESVYVPRGAIIVKIFSSVNPKSNYSVWMSINKRAKFIFRRILY